MPPGFRYMPYKSAFWLIPALLAAGCGERPAAAPGQAEQTAPVASTASGETVRAVSPFGSREALSPPAVDEIAIPRGTRLRVRLTRAVDTSVSRPGDHFTATLDNPVLDGARVVIPRGTLFNGHLVSAKPSGRLRGRGILSFTLDSFELGGNTYEIATSSVSRTSGDHKRRNAGLIGGGAGLGAVLGAIAGGAKGALIGAGAGAAAGTAGAAVTGRRHVRVPAEALLVFSLERTLSVR